MNTTASLSTNKASATKAATATPVNASVQDLPVGQLLVSLASQTTVVCPGVGSSLVVVVYDSAQRISGLAHILLADSQLLVARNGLTSSGLDASCPAQFADLAIPALLQAFEAKGGQRATTTVRMAGGAQLFNFGGGGGNPLNVGSRNAIACRALFAKQGLRLTKTDVGGNKVRTITYHAHTGQLLVQGVGSTSPIEL
jgi:chemotaxis protein CheD